MATLTVGTKAPVLDQDGHPLGVADASTHGVNSSDSSVAEVQWINWHPWIIAKATGDVTLTAVRLADGASAVLELEVVAQSLPPFSISLG